MYNIMKTTLYSVKIPHLDPELSEAECVFRVEKLLQRADREDLIQTFDLDACMVNDVRELCEAYYDKFWCYAMEG